MKVRVIKPIPGKGYYLGECAVFSPEETERLLNDKYVEPAEEKETATPESKKEKASKK